MTSFKRFLIGSALAAAIAAPVVAPTPADAWGVRAGWGVHPGYGWHRAWGWHAGWGWRGAVYVGGPALAVVGPPVVYAPRPYRWVPGYYAYNGAFVPAHWGY